jgi:hypothetical protein
MITQFFFTVIIFILSSGAFAAHDEIIDRMIKSKVVIDQQAALVHESMVEKRPLTGRELYDINAAAAERLKTRAEAYAIFSKDFDLVKEPIKKNFTITDEKLKSLILSLSVAVTLYDTTLYTYHQFHGNPKLRRLLNESDSAFRRENDTFDKSIEGLFSMKNILYFNRAIKIFKTYYLENASRNDDSELQKASHVIQASYLYYHFKNPDTANLKKDFFLLLITRIKISAKAKYDFFRYMANSVVYNGSKLFGNIVGGFQKRHGFLHHDQNFLATVEGKIRPMDILLEKTPFRLTDQFIPGYWGHAAIYIGTQEDRERLGLWEHELVQKYAEEIEDGKYVVEALRDRVKMNSLDHFSDIDDFALLRLRTEMTDKQIAEHILRALSHVGKKYDFNFDVETGDKIVCSELHYRTYIDIHFNTSTYLGRSTISVDQVAEQARSNMPFSPVLLYIQGQEIDEADLQSTFNELLKNNEKNNDKTDDKELVNTDNLEAA